MTNRSHLMDGLRVLAAHVIVLHHLASYGPLADALAQAAPVLHQLLFDYGRFATQIFLVMAGYLAAQGLQTARQGALVQRLRQRYLRLVPPFALAIALVALVVEVLRPWVGQDWLTAPSSLWQWVSHVLLIQDLVGQPSMTVGAWYVAIDFQLFMLLSLVAWGIVRVGAGQGALVASVALLTLASQWFFNLYPGGDIWAGYFLESYGVGVLLAWTRARTPMAATARAWLGVCLASALAAGWLYPRPRLWLTVLVCLVLFGWAERWQPAASCSSWLQRHSDIAYALFLTHFAPLVLANALWIQIGADSPVWGVILLVLTWGACAGVAVIFHRSVETLMRKAWRR
jgi:peptidoglycan/LPS O-acetylase OafA/YrhL